MTGLQDFKSKLSYGLCSTVFGVFAIVASITADSLLTDWLNNPNAQFHSYAYTRAENLLIEVGFFSHLFCLCLAYVSIMAMERKMVWWWLGLFVNCVAFVYYSFFMLLLHDVITLRIPY